MATVLPVPVEAEVIVSTPSPLTAVAAPGARAATMAARRPAAVAMSVVSKTGTSAPSTVTMSTSLAVESRPPLEKSKGANTPAV